MSEIKATIAPGLRKARLRGRERRLSNQPREVPTIQAVTRLVTRSDMAFGQRGEPQRMPVSLARVKGFFEETPE